MLLKQEGGMDTRSAASIKSTTEYEKATIQIGAKSYSDQAESLVCQVRR